MHTGIYVTSLSTNVIVTNFATVYLINKTFLQCLKNKENLKSGKVKKIINIFKIAISLAFNLEKNYSNAFIQFNLFVAPAPGAFLSCRSEAMSKQPFILNSNIKKR